GSKGSTIRNDISGVWQIRYTSPSPLAIGVCRENLTRCNINHTGEMLLDLSRHDNMLTIIRYCHSKEIFDSMRNSINHSSCDSVGNDDTIRSRRENIFAIIGPYERRTYERRKRVLLLSSSCIPNSKHFV